MLGMRLAGHGWHTQDDLVWFSSPSKLDTVGAPVDAVTFRYVVVEEHAMMKVKRRGTNTAGLSQSGRSGSGQGMAVTNLQLGRQPPMRGEKPERTRRRSSLGTYTSETCCYPASQADHFPRRRHLSILSQRAAIAVTVSVILASYPPAHSHYPHQLLPPSPSPSRYPESTSGARACRKSKQATQATIGAARRGGSVTIPPGPGARGPGRCAVWSGLAAR